MGGRERHGSQVDSVYTHEAGVLRSGEEDVAIASITCLHVFLYYYYDFCIFYIHNICGVISLSQSWRASDAPVHILGLPTMQVRMFHLTIRVFCQDGLMTGLCTSSPDLRAIGTSGSVISLGVTSTDAYSTQVGSIVTDTSPRPVLVLWLMVERSYRAAREGTRHRSQSVMTAIM